MTLIFWVLGLVIYAALIVVLARVVGFNQLDGETRQPAADGRNRRQVFERRLKPRAAS